MFPSSARLCIQVISLPGIVPVVGLLVVFGLVPFKLVALGLIYTEEALLGTYEVVGEIDGVT